MAHISILVNSRLGKGGIKSIVDSRLQGNFDTAELKECLGAERAHVGKNLETASIELVSMNILAQALG